MDVRSLLLGSKIKVAVTALGLLSASVGGAFALGLLGAPGVVGVENRFGVVTEETTVVETDLVVENPNPIGIRLGNTTINYTVYMNDVALANGSKRGVRVEPGNSTLEFTTRMRNERIPPWWASHVRNGERTNVTIDARVRTGVLGDRTFEPTVNRTVETAIISEFNSDETRPVNSPRGFTLFDNPILYVNETRGQWGTVPPDDSVTPVEMELDVYNPQAQPYVVAGIGYNVTMNGIQVGEGTTDSEAAIPPRGTETIETTPTIRNDRLDEWWVSHLRNGQVTELRIEFYALVEIPDPVNEEVRVPLNDLTIERTIETDIFGTKSEGRAGAGGGSSDGEATPTTGDGGGTPTGTPTPGETPTPTPTDDLL